ncbi:MAG: hypothetical protein GKS01_07605 [Alphaproteobacteria bacterium]|nr:hypothetical protein [Alphaproteobacteria bacterium]
MKIADQINELFPECFTILILDNEVTLDAFITDPPLKWARLVNESGAYSIAKNYPTSMTKAESDREEMNWDKVDLNALRDALSDLNNSVDLVAIGNNASQGLPLAEALPSTMRSQNAAIIYGTSLPEKPIYQAIGYQTFCTRDDLLKSISQKVQAAGKELALCFINTIEHNDQNYHAPWTPR